MAEEQMAPNTKVTWKAVGRMKAGLGTLTRYETNGEGRGRKTFAVVVDAEGKERRFFPKQITRA